MADFSRFTGVGSVESSEVDRQAKPERDVRPQNEREHTPDAYRKKLEVEGHSEWSGGMAGGGTWGGRSR
jgi:hypothetical protein